VSVQGTSVNARTGTDGTFVLRGLLAGTRTLRVWANGKQANVQVNAGDLSVQIRVE
jgi:hypothetical protein